MYYKSHIRLVNAHTEANCGNDDLYLTVHPGLLAEGGGG